MYYIKNWWYQVYLSGALRTYRFKGPITNVFWKVYLPTVPISVRPMKKRYLMKNNSVPMP